MTERRYSPYEDEELICTSSPMAAKPARVLAGALLGLGPKSVLAAVDCAANAALFEAARLCPEGRVYAVERPGDDCDLVRITAKNLGLAHLTLLEGTAPQVLWPVSRCDALLMEARDETALDTIAWAGEHLQDSGTLLIMTSDAEHITPLMREVRENFERADLMLTSISLEEKGRFQTEPALFLIQAARPRRFAS